MPSVALFIPEAASLWSSALMGSLFARIMMVRTRSGHWRDLLVMTSVVFVSLLYSIVVILNGANAITASVFRGVGAPLVLAVAPLITLPACVRIWRAMRLLHESARLPGTTEAASSRVLSDMQCRRSARFTSHVRRYVLASSILVATQLSGLYLSKAVALVPTFYEPGVFFMFGVLCAVGPLGAGLAKMIAFSTPRSMSGRSKSPARRRGSLQPAGRGVGGGGDEAPTTLISGNLKA